MALVFKKHCIYIGIATCNVFLNGKHTGNCKDSAFHQCIKIKWQLYKHKNTFKKKVCIANYFKK